MGAIVNALVFVVERVIQSVLLLLSLFVGRREHAAKFKIEGNSRSVVAAACLAAILASVTSIFLGQCSRTSALDLTADVALGESMAELTAGLLNHKGKILVIGKDAKKLNSHGLEAQMRAFEQTLSQPGGITVLDTELVSMPSTPSKPSALFTGEMFFKMLESQPDADAIVSFVGAPPLTRDEISALPSKRPKLIALAEAGMTPVLQQLLDDGVVQMAIVPRPYLRPQAGQPLRKPGSRKECFDLLYEVITPRVTTPDP